MGLMDLFLNLLKYSQKFPNLDFCGIFDYLSYGLLKIHRKLTSGYLFCDKAFFIDMTWLCFLKPSEFTSF